jgi:hypothetical protein
MIPVGAKNHATLLFVDRENDNAMGLADSSLAHTKITNQTAPRPSIFGYLSRDRDIAILSPASLQINGCCSFWVDSLAEAINNDPTKYQDMATIREAFGNGSLWLEAAAIMSKTFDAPNLETVKVFTSEDEAIAQNANYVTFKIGGKYYGISKNCWKNKFINIGKLTEKLKEILPKEAGNAIGNQLKTQIERQNLIIPFETSIYRCNKINQEQLDIFNKLIQKRREIGEKFDAFLEYVRKKIKKQILAQHQPQQQRQLRQQWRQQPQSQPLSIGWIDNVIKIIKAGNDLTLGDPLISGIRDRYIGLKTHTNELTKLIDQDPSLTLENLKQNEHYTALSKNNVDEKKGKILGPSDFGSFCKFFAETAAEFESKTTKKKENFFAG